MKARPSADWLKRESLLMLVWILKGPNLRGLWMQMGPAMEWELEWELEGLEEEIHHL